MQLAQVVQRSPSKVAAYRASRRRAVPSSSQTLSQVGAQNWKATAFQATMHCGLQGEALM